MQVEQFKEQQYPEFKLYNEVQAVQIVAELQIKHPVEQDFHIPNDK